MLICREWRAGLYRRCMVDNAGPVPDGQLTGRVEQSSDRLCRRQLVVQRDRLRRLGAVRRDASLVEELERTRVDPELELHAKRQNDHRRAAVREFLNILRLNARIVAGSGL